MWFKALVPFCFALAMLARPGGLKAQDLSIVAFGDSLMAGYELSAGDAYPAKLEAALERQGIAVTITNGAVSGDTSADGLSRLDWTIPDGTDAVLLELGANDALRGLSPADTRRNLDAMIARLKERKIAVMLFGMLAPPNMGTDFSTAFNAIYPDLAKAHDVPLYPFFLDAIVTESSLKLADGMHPNPKGVDRMVEQTLPAVKTFISTLKLRAK